MSSGHLHFLERAVDQRKRAGEIKGTDPLSVAKREALIKMAERNETSAEIQQRKKAGQPTQPAVDAIRKIDAQLVEIHRTLDGLGVTLRRKK